MCGWTRSAEQRLVTGATPQVCSRVGSLALPAWISRNVSTGTYELLCPTHSRCATVTTRPTTPALVPATFGHARHAPCPTRLALVIMPYAAQYPHTPTRGPSPRPCSSLSCQRDVVLCRVAPACPPPRNPRTSSRTPGSSSSSTAYRFSVSTSTPNAATTAWPRASRDSKQRTCKRKRHAENRLS